MAKAPAEQSPRIPSILQHVPFPDKLAFRDDASRKKDWEMFLQIWENYEISSQLIEHPKRRRTATLLTCFSPSALKVYNSLSFDRADDKQDIDKVIEKMTEFCQGVVNETYERYLFNTRSQQVNESIDEFYAALLSLSKNCAFKELTPSLIKDRIIVGIQDNSTRQKLLSEKGLTLEKCLEIARSYEATKQRMKTMEKGEGEASVQRVHKPKHQKQLQQQQPNSKSTAEGKPKQTNDKKCFFCGKGIHKRQNCPARNATCNNCGKKGHFKAVCQSKNVREIHQDSDDESQYDSQDSDDDEPQDDAFLGSVNNKLHNKTSSKDWTVDVCVDNNNVNFKIDTGADVNIISDKIYNSKFRHKPLLPVSKVIRGPDQKPLPILGYIKCTISKGDKSICADVYVLKGGTPLLDRETSVALNIVSLVNNVESYPQLFKGLGEMPIPYKIELQPDAKPFSVQYPRRIPVPLMPKVKKELDRLESLNVIKRITEPTEWCAPIVVVPKSKDQVRLCVDYTRLNEAVKREKHMLPTVDQVLAQMAGATVFSKLDANCGFHQITLTDDSRPLTAFITPYGRYCYNRLPFGINSGPEHFQMQIHRILEDQPGAVSLIDDTVIYGKDLKEHDERLNQVLQKLSNAKITLNKEKCQFRKSEISSLGQTVGKDGIKPDAAKVTAIVNMEAPQNVGELRRFLGMVNQLGKFLPNLATVTDPLRGLLSSSSSWHWDQPQRHAFDEIKRMLTSSPVLSLYDPNAPTKVTADSSSYGLGAVLTQQQSDGRWSPVVYASRSLTPAERRYAQIEKEALAATWSCSRFQDYLIGITFTLETDHKPLVPLLGTSKSLDELPPRIQRMKMRLMRYSYKIVHVPGKELYTADTLSRAPIVTTPNGDDDSLTHEINSFVNLVMEGVPATDSRLVQIRQHQLEDDVCRELVSYLQESWPEKEQLKGLIRQYWPHRASLTIIDGLLMYETRIVIPSSLRQDILEKLHEGHQGITKCRRLAIQSVWWPGLSKNIKELIENCRVCCQAKRSHPEPLIPTVMPQHPWQKLAADLMEIRKSQYLVVIDYYSRYIELAKLESSTTSKEVINHLKSIMARHGIPETMLSDNGPQFASKEFSLFANEYGFSHVTSSPLHSSGNGEVERAVRTAKNLIDEAKDPYIALLNYRNTPLENGYSPAQLLMSRMLRTKIPVMSAQVQPTALDQHKLRDKEERGKINMKVNFDARHSTKPLPVLQQGDKVWIKDRKESATEREEVHDRSYLVDTQNSTFRRNRVQLN